VIVAKKKTLQGGRIFTRKGLDEMSSTGFHRQDFFVCIFLVMIVFAVFGQTAHFGFINYDDSENVYENEVVQKGLSERSVFWAFTHTQVANWIPLTTISHMAVCQFFGINAGAHHLVNVLLHAAAAALLFLALRQMTGRFWRSAFVAAFFAVHPLRVESVVWVSERKDVLSASFFMLVLLAYARFVRIRSNRDGTGNGASSYLLALVFFVCGLMSKPMVATLPFVLLLLDYWPLKRFSVSGFQFSALLRLGFEKLPFFALSAASCVAVAFVPGLAVVPPPGFSEAGNNFSLVERIGNALVSYVIYLRQMVFPSGLAMPYPVAQSGVPSWEAGLALIVLMAISGIVFFWRARHPFLLVGWLWFLGMLVPVIGIVEISDDVSHADRYTYLPEIGLVIAVTWLVADWGARWKNRRLILGGMIVVIIGTLMACAHVQTLYWRDGETLWRRALSCTSANTIALNNFGLLLSKSGRVEEAIAQYQAALAINPDYAKARNNLGIALFQNGELDSAVAQYRKLLKISPDYADAYMNFGNVLSAKGQIEEAIAQYRKALGIKPDDIEAGYNLGTIFLNSERLEEAVTQYSKVLELSPDAVQTRCNLAIALYKQGKINAAILQYQKALEINPRYAEAHNNLGVALMKVGRLAEAMDEYRKAIEIKPQYLDALNNLAWMMAVGPQASLQNGLQAVNLAQQAVQLSGGENPMTLRSLAAAYADTGQYAQAVETAKNAIKLAKTRGDLALAGTLEEELEMYQMDTPLREAKP
jgi:tetratricopeptide (TPR) repeat protein